MKYNGWKAGNEKMGTLNGMILEDEFMHFDTTAVISDILEGYQNDDLIELLCECETLLETNGMYLKKLDEHGYRKLYNVIEGIEDKCKYRIQNNHQRLLTITLAIQKRILSSFGDLTLLVQSLVEKSDREHIFTQRCINFLLQKIRDHSMALKAVNTDVELGKWEKFEVKNYISETHTKQVLQITSDIYSITRGSCIYDMRYLEAAIEQLQLQNVGIKPEDFAEEILKDSTCLPLYIKDGLNYNDIPEDISEYGSIIYQAYKLVIDPNIQDLSNAREEALDALCLPLLKKSIDENNIEPTGAAAICNQLIGDLKCLHLNYVKEREDRQKLAGQREREEKEKQVQMQNELEDQKKYIFAVVSPSKLIECDLTSYTERVLHPTSTYSFSEGSMKTIQEQISSFSPSAVIKPYSFSDEKKLVMNNNCPHIESLSNFYFCLWYKTRKEDRGLDKNARHVIFIDHYDRYFYPSRYSLDGTGNTPRYKHANKGIYYSVFANNITKDDIFVEFFSKDMQKGDFNSGISKGEIVLYRTFDEVYAAKILKDVHYVGEFAETLKELDVRKSTIDLLYNFNNFEEIP